MKTGFIRINIIDGHTATIDLELIDNTVWLSGWEIGELLNIPSGKIEKTIEGFFKEDILDEREVRFDYSIDNGQKIITYYNLDVLLHLCFRLHNAFTRLLREWFRDGFIQSFESSRNFYLSSGIEKRKNYCLN